MHWKMGCHCERPRWVGGMVPWQPQRVQWRQVQSPLCGAAVQAGVSNCLGDSSGAEGLGTVVMKLVMSQQLQWRLTTYWALLEWVTPPIWHSGDHSWSSLVSNPPTIPAQVMSTNCRECTRGKIGLEHIAHEVTLKVLSLLTKERRGLQK